MKRALKRVLSLAVVTAVAVTLMPSVSAKADGERNYQWGPFNVSNALKTITLSPEDSYNIFNADNALEILVLDDYCEIELDYDRMGWKPEDFSWGELDEDDGVFYVDPMMESSVYGESAAIVNDSVDGWKLSGGSVPVAFTDVMVPGTNGYFQYDYNKFVVEFDDDGSKEYWLYAVGVEKLDEEYSWGSIFLLKSEYEILKEQGFPILSETPVTAGAADTFVPGPEGMVYRLFNPANGDHIYTVNQDEARNLVASGWNQEDSPGMSAGSDGVAVYRLTNDASGEHLFTADKREKNTLAKNGWTVDNGGSPAFYGSKEGKAVYRLFNPNAASAIDSHHFTLDKNEIKVLTKQMGWVMDNDGKPIYYLN